MVENWKLVPGKAKDSSRRRGLRSKMAIIVIALIVMLMGADALWNYNLQRTQAEIEAREKLRCLLPKCAPCRDSSI